MKKAHRRGTNKRRQAVRHMAIDDAAMVRHIDALLRDFVANNRTLFEFWGDLPTGSALSEAGWQFFRDGDLRLRDDDESLPRLELVGDLDSRKIAAEPEMVARLRGAADRRCCRSVLQHG